MRYLLFTNAVLISLCTTFDCATPLPDATPEETNFVEDDERVSLRFHAQWSIDEGTRKKVHEAFGISRVTFDHRGVAVPHGLSSHQVKRWERLYNLCMSDGCYYCDAPEGSCELGTCGPQNAYCKPYMGQNGHPICGVECADYAFTSILPCNDPSNIK